VIGRQGSGHLAKMMMEKLAAMRLLGMIEALKAQEQEPSARELSFQERLGLLVDQQWTGGKTRRSPDAEEYQAAHAERLC
jgi:hypothetical protein